MATDALALCIARTSAAMAWTMQDKHILVFHKDINHLCRLNIKKWWKIHNVILYFLKEIQPHKG